MARFEKSGHQMANLAALAVMGCLLSSPQTPFVFASIRNVPFRRRFIILLIDHTLPSVHCGRIFGSTSLNLRLSKTYQSLFTMRVANFIYLGCQRDGSVADKSIRIARVSHVRSVSDALRVICYDATLLMSVEICRLLIEILSQDP